MKVFILYHADAGDFWGVFSSREKADAENQRINSNPAYQAWVVEMELDKTREFI